MAKIIMSDHLVEALTQAGIADENTRRVVIDLQVGHVPVVHIERYGDEQLIKVVRALEGVQVTKVEGSAHGEQDRAQHGG